MQEVSCRHCGEVVPRNESFSALDYDICAPCLEKELQDNPGFSQGDLKPNVDLTVCFACGADAGYREYQKKFDFPVCEACTPNFGNMPFPLWIKASAVAVLLFVVLSFGLNARFWKADEDIAAYWAAMDEGNLEQTLVHARSARDRVPEVYDLLYLELLSEGLIALSEERMADASELLTRCVGHFPPEMGLGDLAGRATMYASFEEEDYDAFLDLAMQRLIDDVYDNDNYLVVASAYACKYAETGKEWHEQKANEMIDKFEEAGGGEGGAEYINRIRYRLHSREIIKTEEFMARYPDGWTDPEGGK